jgi:hypothetical protein
MDPMLTSSRINVIQGDDWIIVAHFKKYSELLKNIDEFVNAKISNLDYVTSDDCDYSPTFWNILKDNFKDEPLSNMVEKITEDILTCDNCLVSTANPRTVYDPAIGKVDGIFAKLVNALDKGVGNFLQNYTMAKQVSKFECDFMEMFRLVQEIQDAIKFGYIMDYFDKIYTEFRLEFEKFNIYITYNNYNVADPDCKEKQNMSYAYYNAYTPPDIGQASYSEDPTIPFVNAITNYRNQLRVALKDLNTLIDAMEGFMDDIYVAVKVLGALNIVFYADPADQEMLAKDAESTFASMTPPAGSDLSTDMHKLQLQSYTIWAQAVSVPLAIAACKYINDRRTNQATVFGSTVKAAFFNIGLQQRIDMLRDVLETQHT